MVKRLCRVMVSTVLFLSLGAFVALGEETVDVEQVQVNLPDCHVSFQAPEGWDYQKENVRIQFQGEQYTPEDVVPASLASDPVHYYFLVDCSTSTRENQIAAVKRTLTSFTEHMKEEDTVTLITFGLSVDVVLDHQKDKGRILETVDSLKADQRGTLFFDAIAKAVQLGDQQVLAGERKMAFIFSDSIDVNLGGYTSQEISSLLSGGNLPFYGLGFDTGTKEGLDGLGAVSRQSGGQIEIVSAENLEETFFRMYGDTQEMWVATFQTDGNRIAASEQTLVLEMDTEFGVLTDRIPVRCKFWQPDTTAPRVILTEQKGAQSIELTFDEAVLQAGDIANYKVTDWEGNFVPVLSAAYDREAKSVWLNLGGELKSGAYRIGVKGITDASMEENVLEATLELSAQGPEDPGENLTESMAPEEENQGGSMAAWYVLTVVTVGIVVAVAFSVKKKRERSGIETWEKNGTERERVCEQFVMPGESEVQVRFTSVPSMEIRLKVEFQSGESQMLELPIRNTLFVGRSEICDVCIDDMDLSRQHFVIQEMEGSFSITNLSETNGTRLNGIPLNSPRNLQSGDLIEAGQECFTFYEGGMKS